MAVPAFAQRRLVVRASRRPFVLLACVSAVFVAGGAFLLLRHPDRLTGYATTIFFGGCAAVALGQLRVSPRLVIDEEGLFDRTLGVGVIPWGELQGAFVRAVGGHRFVCLELRDPDGWRARLGPVRRVLAGANRRLGCTDFNINTFGLPVTAAEILALVTARLEAAGTAPVAEGGSPAMGAEGRDEDGAVAR